MPVMQFGYDKLILILLAWNLITFLLMGLDKRLAVKGKRRISESTLILLALLFGAVGVFIAMPVFHHKTKKPLFLIMVPVALAVNILMAVGVHTFIG